MDTDQDDVISGEVFRRFVAESNRREAELRFYIKKLIFVVFCLGMMSAWLICQALFLYFGYNIR